MAVTDDAHPRQVVAAPRRHHHVGSDAPHRHPDAIDTADHPHHGVTTTVAARQVRGDVSAPMIVTVVVTNVVVVPIQIESFVCSPCPIYCCSINVFCVLHYFDHFEKNKDTFTLLHFTLCKITFVTDNTQKMKRYPVWTEWSSWSPCQIDAALSCIGYYNRTRNCNLSDTIQLDAEQVDRDAVNLFGNDFVCGTSKAYYWWTGLNYRNVTAFETHRCHDQTCSKCLFYEGDTSSVRQTQFQSHPVLTGYCV